MPNRPVHILAAAPAGFVYAAHKSFGQNDFPRLLESLGGVVGGAAGGALPDVIDPPESPWHRSLGHGLVPVGWVGVLWAENLDSWQAQLRRLADYHQKERLLATDAVIAFWHSIVEWALRVLAGFVAGVGAGYLSHVFLDSWTPCCIPLVG